MQANLTLKNGKVIPLTDEIYETILQIVDKNNETVAPADSIEELEAEFAELFTAAAATTKDLLRERAEELKREKRKLELFG
ncbi:MAG: hypothetical protein ACR2GD_02500 [Pyrinomonadaceae bacterium]